MTTVLLTSPAVPGNRTANCRKSYTCTRAGTKRIEDSYYAFLEVSREAQRVTEQAYLNTRG